MRVNGQICPCKYCVAPRRHSGCHSSCQAYIEWKEQLNNENEKEKADKQTQCALSDFKRAGVEKALRKNGSIKRRMHHK